MKNVKFSSSIFLGIYLLAAVIFMIVPLTSGLLDVLITFNLSIAMIILFNCIFAKETLSMSSFPTILLLPQYFGLH